MWQEQAARQADINERVAVALERLNGRMESMEQWREERDRERERHEERRDTREDKRAELTRSDITVALTAGLGLLNLLILVAQHWH